MGQVAGYRSRVVDEELRQALGGTTTVLIEGARGVGKTATASQEAASCVFLDVDQGARTAAAIDPSLVLSGPAPRLIDEWQEFPSIWDHVRRAVDRREGPFILTGSAVPADGDTRHTGAGRFSRLRMRPMCLLELGRSTGTLSLGQLLDGGTAETVAEELTIPELVEITCRGGWPALIGNDAHHAQRVLADYLESVARTDIRRVDGVARDPEKVRRVLRSLARNIGTEVSTVTITRDAGGFDGAIDVDTVRAYLAALERLMVVENQPAWAPRLRSRARLRSAPKRHFCDPSLATAAMGATPATLMKDLNHFGFLFESLVVRDLRVYAQHNHAQVLHYRDSVGEVDVIVEDGNRWAAMEVTLGAAQIESAAANLLRFAARVDTGVCGEPAFLGVIVPTRYGYLRDDGVRVIPVQALAP